MERKYHMTVEENIFFAKRNIVDYIWKSSRLEGLNLTFPQTYAIYEKAKVQNIDVRDVIVVNNLKRGWQMILDNIYEPVSLDYLCRLHAEVGRDDALFSGVLRTGEVGVSGTDYIPPIPVKEEVEAELSDVLAISDPLERSLHFMFWAMKRQLFWDGNKRTAMLMANKIMIENGCGVISVPNDKIEAFNTYLSDYYTNGTLQEAMEYTCKNCVDGTSFRNKNTNAAVIKS